MAFSNRNIYQQKKNQPQIPLLWTALAVLMGLFLIRETMFSDFSPSKTMLAKILGLGVSTAKPESLLVYDWKDPALGAMKQHMEFVRMESDVVPRKKKKYYDINYVHQNALLHTGIWAAVIDTNITMEEPKILFLKRGPQLVTCPSTWGLLGEHTYRNEAPKDTVLRGLKEELGDAFYKQFLKTGANTRPLLKHPIFFHKDFHNDGSLVDRQMTYLYVIEMNTPLEKLQSLIKVDDEVAEVRWMTRQEIQDGWMNHSPNEKFCQHEMAILLQLVLHRLEDLEKQANAPKYAAIQAAKDKAKAEEEAAKQAAEQAAVATNTAKAKEEDDEDSDSNSDE